MRVANKTVYDMVKFDLGRINEELNKANRVVTTGKRITDLSDDPVRLSEALNVRSALSNLEQLGRNIDMGRSWLATSESALSQVQNLISDTRALCVQMVNGTITPEQRAMAAEMVQNTIEEFVSLANTEVNGQYVFAGWKTDTIPFDQDGTYNGDNHAFAIKIGNDTTVEVGSDGEAVFETLFTTVSDLKDALEGNDVGGISAAMTNLDKYFGHITTKISSIGSKMVRMDMKERIFQDWTLTSTERLSKIEDADMAEAILELQSRQVVFQAALASSARVMKLSLVDFLT
ncbi:MAG: flagellar hook-associated protein FlgL [Deltaproteobacteria bacterium]|nr:flagellar hook-associated protein FlgL [Deltaproteobacteria bacterium]